MRFRALREPEDVLHSRSAAEDRLKPASEPAGTLLIGDLIAEQRQSVAGTRDLVLNHTAHVLRRTVLLAASGRAVQTSTLHADSHGSLGECGRPKIGELAEICLEALPEVGALHD